MERMSRRSFLKVGTAASAALAMAPTDVLAKAKSKKTAKATDLKNWFEIEEIQFRSNGGKFHGLKLIKRLI